MLAFHAQRPEPRPQGFDFIQQLQRQRGAGEIDAQIALQAQGHVGAAHVGAGEAPAVGFAPDRREHPLLHQFDNTFGVYRAGAADFGQRQLGLFFQDESAQLRQHFLDIHAYHVYTPSLARGLKDLNCSAMLW